MLTGFASVPRWLRSFADVVSAEDLCLHTRHVPGYGNCKRRYVMKLRCRTAFASIVATSFIAAPASAQDSASIGAQFAEAHRAFATAGASKLTQDNPLFATGLVDGLDGEWLAMSALANLQDDLADPAMTDDLIERFCGADKPIGIRIDTSGGADFTVSKVMGDVEVAQTYTSVGGNRYIVGLADTDAFIDAMGLRSDETEDAVRMRNQILSGVLGDRHVYRPSPDILVIDSRSPPEINVRCPS